MALKNKVKAGRSPYYEPAVGSVGFTIGTEATNAITVNLQAKDPTGADMAARSNLNWYLSGDANGDSVAAAASGGVAAGTDGALLQTVTGRAGFLTTENDGDADVVITDNTGRTVYLVIVLPDGTLNVSGAITFAA